MASFGEQLKRLIGRRGRPRSADKNAEFVKFAILGCALAIGQTAPAISKPSLTPIRLHAGVNRIPNIAGDGAPGSISLRWRENGNAWGYDIFTVFAGGSIVTLDGHDEIADQPHTGDDMVTSVRFARGDLLGKPTLFALIAERNIVDSVPDPAETTIRIYALERNDDGLGTPYEFRQVRRKIAARRYCNADMALQTELGFPIARSYSGPRTVDGCQR